MASTSTYLGLTDDLNMMRPVKINIPTTPDDRSEPQPSPNLPRADLLNGRREDFIKICVPLYQASVNGDWQAAKAILDKRPELVRFAITDNYETALHVAVLAKDSKLMEDFEQNLVNMMEMEDLELQNKNYNTALCLVAATGCVKKAKIMVSKNKSLLDIPGSQGAMPMHLAALYGKRKMLNYIYSNSRRMTGDFWTDENRGWVVSKCVKADIFDVALQIVKDHPQLASHKPTVSSVLSTLCRKTYAFEGIEQNIIWRIIYSIFPIIHTKVGPYKKEGDALKLLRSIWRTTMEMPKPDIDAILIGTDEVDRWKPSSGALFVAAEMGNTRFLVELIRAYPDLIWKVDSDGLSIFHIAVMHRHHDIYNLLYEIGSMKDFIVPLISSRHGNNMLHLVGRTTEVIETLTASRASLLIQRELMWFKEVEQMLPPSYRQMKNNDGDTPYELFYKEHYGLVHEGLNWVDYSTVVGTLIITIAFAVAFAIPGGYNQDNGFPIFIHECIFIVFIIADAISLFSSSTSVLVFLSVIIDRRRTEQQYMESLPRKLMMGLVTLFISITAMMFTFSTSLFILYRNGLKWVPILISVFAAMTVLLFATMQYPLLVDMCRSTYDATYLFKPKKRMLYIRNPRF